MVLAIIKLRKNKDVNSFIQCSLPSHDQSKVCLVLKSLLAMFLCFLNPLYVLYLMPLFDVELVKEFGAKFQTYLLTTKNLKKIGNNDFSKCWVFL